MLNIAFQHKSIKIHVVLRGKILKTVEQTFFMLCMIVIDSVDATTGQIRITYAGQTATWNEGILDPGTCLGIGCD